MILSTIVFLWLFAFNAPLFGGTPITVFAAASLTEVLQVIAQAYALEHPEQISRVRFSFAASSTLAQQIRAGAEGDIFFSAHHAWMDKLEQFGHIEVATRRSLLSNRLVAVIPHSTQSTPNKDFQVACLQDWLDILGSSGRIALGDPDHVPAGLYARSALQNLGLWSVLHSRLARAENVRVAFMWVLRQEVPIGIVYQSDLRISPRVRLLSHFPIKSSPKIIYPMAILSGHNTQLVQHFFEFLQKEHAKKLYRLYGFEVF